VIVWRWLAIKTMIALANFFSGIQTIVHHNIVNHWHDVFNHVVRVAINDLLTDITG
jgi:hypothetical protein